MKFPRFYKQHGTRNHREFASPLDATTLEPLQSLAWHQLSNAVAPVGPKDVLVRDRINMTTVGVLLAPTAADTDRARVTPVKNYKNLYIRRFVRSDRVLFKAIKDLTVTGVQAPAPVGRNTLYCHESTKLGFAPATTTATASSVSQQLMESVVLYMAADARATKRHQGLLIDLSGTVPDATKVRALARLPERERLLVAETHGPGCGWLIEIALKIIGSKSVLDHYDADWRLFNLALIDVDDLITFVNLGMLLENAGTKLDTPIDPLLGLPKVSGGANPQDVMKLFLANLKASIGEIDVWANPADGVATASPSPSHVVDDDGLPVATADDDVATRANRSAALASSVLDAYVDSDDTDYAASIRADVALGRRPKSLLKALSALEQGVASVASPWDGTALPDYVQVTPKDLEITTAETRLDVKSQDESYHHSALKVFDSKYIEKILHRDLASCFTGLSDGGFFVQAMEVKKIQDAGKSMEVIDVKIKHLEGQPSTLRIEIPIVNAEGVMYSNGSKRRMKKQWTDIPVRKTKLDEVMLSAAPGKLFVSTVRLKTLSTSGQYRSIVSRYAVKNPDTLHVRARSTFDGSVTRPRVIEDLSLSYSSIRYMGWDLDFRVDQGLPDDVAAAISALGGSPCGKYKGAWVYVDTDSQFWTLKPGNDPVAAGDLYDILDFIDYRKIPAEFAEIKLLGKRIPLAVVLLSYMGLSDLIRACGDPVTITPSSTRLALRPNEAAITTLDSHIVMERGSTVALVLSGLRVLKDWIAKASDDQLNDTAFNGAMVLAIGLKARHENQLLTLRDMFIDPLTARRLKALGYPVKLKLLLIEAVKLLRTKKVDPPTHADGFDLKGYERIPAIVYKALYGAAREYNNQRHLKRRGLKLNPKEAWMAVMMDKTVHLVNEGNPIHAIKETEAYTLIGDGGRSKEAIVERDREIHPSAIGMISEASVDSGDAGVNRYLPFAPTIKSLSGDHTAWTNQGTGSIFSIGAATAPFSNKDHPPRTMFAGIQASHIIPIKGAKQPIIRTGAEEAVVARSGNHFIKRAKGPGVVTGVDTHVTVKYDDPDIGVVKYSLATRTSVTPSLLLPRKIDTLRAVGDRLVLDDHITFCSDYFEENWIHPKRLMEKRSVIGRTALLEIIETEDDSSSVSAGFAESLATEISIERTSVLPFSQAVSQVVGLGDSVDSLSIIYVMEGYSDGDMSAADADAFSNISKLSEKAEFKGRITDIRVTYNGLLDDMSDSLKKITLASDARLKDSFDEGEANWRNGRVQADFMSRGNPLLENTLQLTFTVTGAIDASSGDKLIIGNQSKSVACDARTSKIWTASDRVEVDAAYSSSGLKRRNITSGRLIGSTNTVCLMVMDHVVKNYKR